MEAWMWMWMGMGIQDFAMSRTRLSGLSGKLPTLPFKDALQWKSTACCTREGGWERREDGRWEMSLVPINIEEAREL